MAILFFTADVNTRWDSAVDVVADVVADFRTLTALDTIEFISLY
jgi:hypothetical protein